MNLDSESEFDPYIEWFEIDPALSPPNIYDLLGILPFESDSNVIQKAFENRLALIRTVQSGPRGKHAIGLIEEVTSARICLLDQPSKQEYDAELRRGNSRPPITIENLFDLNAPPVQGQFAMDTESVAAPPMVEKGASRPMLNYGIYAAVCILLLLGIWWITDSLRNGNGEDDSTQISQDETTKQKKPKKIVNLIEEKKGILPGANNSFSLDPNNGKLEENHPVIIDTTDGKLFDQWKSPKDKVRWEIWINKNGYYEAIVKYNATTNDDFSNLIVKNGDDFSKKTKMRKAEAMDQFFEEEFVVLFRKPGAHVIEFSIEGDAGDFRLHSILLRPNRTTSQ